MPEPDHIVKRNDKGVTIDAVLVDEDFVPVNLSGSAIAFKMAPLSGGTLVVNSPGTLVAGGTAGGVQYEWQVGDTDTEGYYAAEWQVTYGGGDIQTFPNGGYTMIRIVPDLPV